MRPRVEGREEGGRRAGGGREEGGGLVRPDRAARSRVRLRTISKRCQVSATRTQTAPAQRAKNNARPSSVLSAPTGTTSESANQTGACSPSLELVGTFRRALCPALALPGHKAVRSDHPEPSSSANSYTGRRDRWH